MPFAEQYVRAALDRGEFIPHFQPLVDLRSGHISGFEILARWNHPTRGLIAPNRFIPFVERVGMINDLSTALLMQAFAAVRTLPKNFGLSVNLSPAQLHDRSMPDLMHLMADEMEFDLSRLTVELTESALIDDLNLAGAVAADLKNLGIRLALDDFGTGYSSLLHLQAFPFDELKVDGSFVRSVVHSRQSRRITAAVVGLGISLGLQTVAEGIEEQAQANLLARQGCNLGQGFLYGGPIPAAELLAALSRQHPRVGVPTEVPSSVATPPLSFEAHPIEPLSQLRAIYVGAPVGLAFLDCNLRYVNLNQQLADMNGLSVQAHLGRKVSDVLPALYPLIESSLMRALAGEPVLGFEVQAPPETPGGTSITMLGFYLPVRDEAGEILGVSASVVNISSVKQKEEALRESEDNYRHTMELNPQIPWVWDAEGNGIAISSRWQAITGLTPAQAKKRGWLDVVHADDRQRVNDDIKTSLRTGIDVDIEYRIRDGKGAWRWMRSRGSARRNAAGEIIRWYGSVECIDEYKHTLDELRRSEARLRAIFDTAPIGIVLVETSTSRVLSANPRSEQLLGFEFIPDMLWKMEGWEAFDTTGKLIEPSKRPLARAMYQAESTDAEEILLRRPDGSSIWLGLTATPIRFENGDLLGGVLLIQDIDTTRREREHLLELARELTLVASRTTQSSNRNVV
jgi:PAS domain S-box-containing protein